MTIYIGNMSYQVTVEDLKEIFSDYGEVKNVQLPVDRETGRIRGFAFVEMNDESIEDEIIEALNGAEWMTRELKVSKARPRENKRPVGTGRPGTGRPQPFRR